MPVVGQWMGPEWRAIFVPKIEKWWAEELAKNLIKWPVPRARPDDGVVGD
jgi:hypothetical protein